MNLGMLRAILDRIPEEFDELIPVVVNGLGNKLQSGIILVDGDTNLTPDDGVSIISSVKITTEINESDEVE